jgi:hypothetical protein
MTQIVDMPERVCANPNCSANFRPKPGGWNAKYCSEGCKNQVRWSTKARPSRAGQTTYYRRVTKLDPEKLAAHNESVSKARRELRQWLYDYKLERGCMDCGFNSHPAALQFDHNGEKVADISLLRSSIKRMLIEIESGKCVIRCANCHSIKTWAEKNGLPNPSGFSAYVRAEDFAPEA